MVNDRVLISGVDLDGAPSPSPVLLQMNNEDFPARFMHDLGSPDEPRLSSTVAVTGNAMNPAVLLQPVQRTVHVAVVQLACDSVGQPRLDPTRIESAGVVIRRVLRRGGKDMLDPQANPIWAWMKSPQGDAGWKKLYWRQQCLDPDPTKRPQLESGQAELDRMLMTQSLSTALTESYSPAFVAAPAICDRLNRTVLYAVIPTASSEVTDTKPAAPAYDEQAVAENLPNLLRTGFHCAPAHGASVDYHFMSDDYATSHNLAGFKPFSTALRMLYTVFGAFEDTPAARKIIAELNKHKVTFGTGVHARTKEMGTFYQEAAATLIDLDPNSQPPPSLRMPDGWDSFSDQDQNRLIKTLKNSAQERSSKVLVPEARYQDATRLYRLRIFFRIKGHSPGCPPQLVWSKYSEPFRIAAWYEGGRPLPPVPLPDPTNMDFLKSTKPNATFAVPAGLMNSIQASTPSSPSKGSGGLNLNWICGFSIPLITICAFFVLNIFLVLLNIVFFWLPFIKICIPFPVPTPSSGEE